MGVHSVGGQAGHWKPDRGGWAAAEAAGMDNGAERAEPGAWLASGRPGPGRRSARGGGVGELLKSEVRVGVG